MDHDFDFKPNSPIIKQDHRGVEYVLVWLPLEEYATTYLAALRKVRQLESEIDHAPKSDMHHTLSKLWIFARELVPQAIRDRAHALSAAQPGRDGAAGDGP
jgi:hypothetical protein